MAREDSIAFHRTDRTHTHPQKLKLIYLTRQRSTARELRKAVENLPRVVTVPRTGQGSYDGDPMRSHPGKEIFSVFEKDNGSALCFI